MAPPPGVAAAAALFPRQPHQQRWVRDIAWARYLLLGAGAAAAGYGAYRLYRSDVLARLRAALDAYAAAFGTGADTLQLLADDLQRFLRSNASEVPPSLRQLARIMQSPEVGQATSATVAAMLRGVTGGCWERGTAL